MENSMENRKVVHIITVLRNYLDVSLIKLAGDVQMEFQELADMERMPPYGNVEKYLRVADYLEVPVEAIIRNDYTLIPESFFDRHPEGPEYKPVPISQGHLVGRQGEDFVFRRERERLSQTQPVLAKLVLPYYKMNCPSPGYDILSFDNDGVPFPMEVKTSVNCLGAGVPPPASGCTGAGPASGPVASVTIFDFSSAIRITSFLFDGMKKGLTVFSQAP